MSEILVFILAIIGIICIPLILLVIAGFFIYIMMVIYMPIRDFIAQWRKPLVKTLSFLYIVGVVFVLSMFTTAIFSVIYFIWKFNLYLVNERGLGALTLLTDVIILTYGMYITSKLASEHKFFSQLFKELFIHESIDKH